MTDFITQEIGSIQRPLWRQKLDAPPNEEWIASALEWGEKLNVEEKNELANILRKKERTSEEKERIIEISSLYVIKMLEHAGLDRIYNGEQTRTEMYDFLAKHTNGISTAGVLNSFDANYFRKGIITDIVSVKEDRISFFVNEFEFVKKHTKKIVKPCLTGPYTMMDWSYVEHYRNIYEKKGLAPKDAIAFGRRDATLDFARNVLNPIVLQLVEAGATVIQIDEPAAATKEQESDFFVDAINACFEGARNIEKAVHLCYSNYPALFPSLASCKADSYLIEFTNHASSSVVSKEAFRMIELFKEHKMDVTIGVGVIDVHSDLIETPEVVRDRLLYAKTIIGNASRVQVNPDCGLRTRQWNIAYAKLQNMVKGAELARAAGV
ncbi:hypothetical protein J4450_04015 [Candidatus Micrarchaeota archaeon]|nr:hypothetical protein [Candidatus Micrarchaeota archaeon]